MLIGDKTFNLIINSSLHKPFPEKKTKKTHLFEPHLHIENKIKDTSSVKQKPFKNILSSPGYNKKLALI